MRPLLALALLAAGAFVGAAVTAQVATVYYYRFNGGTVEISCEPQPWPDTQVPADGILRLRGSPWPTGSACGGDINGDGKVSMSDFIELSKRWGEDCDWSAPR